MTPREAEILKWIEENPMITQQEIADRASITRASVGVHISNLMKKGLIVGKGYILQSKQYLCVVGGANIDISGTPFTNLLPSDSNPGKTTLSLGGVGRNIAENLSRLGLDVELITLLGEDSYSKEIQQNCRQNGISLTHTQMMPGEHTSTYLCINDKEGEMQLAVSDMEIYRHMTPEYLKGKLEVLNRSAACIADTNIPAESLNYLMDFCQVPLFLDPVSLKKTEKLLPILHNIHTLKPNRLEAELLSGIKIQDQSDLARASERILQLGVKQVFLSLGAEGVYYSNGTEQGLLGCFHQPVVNTTGAGDSFLAAVVWAYLKGLGIREMACAGLAASSICVCSESTVSEKMCVEQVEQRMSEQENL